MMKERWVEKIEDRCKGCEWEKRWVGKNEKTSVKGCGWEKRKIWKTSEDRCG